MTEMGSAQGNPYWDWSPDNEEWTPEMADAARAIFERIASQRVAKAPDD